MLQTTPQVCCFLAESKANPGRLLPPNPRSRDALHTICVPFAKMEKCHDLNHLGWWTPFSILKHIFYVFGKGRSFANIRGIHKHLMDWMSESTTTACPRLHVIIKSCIFSSTSTLQSVMNAKGSQQRIGHSHKNGLSNDNLYVRFQVGIPLSWITCAYVTNASVVFSNLHETTFGQNWVRTKLWQINA